MPGPATPAFRLPALLSIPPLTSDEIAGARVEGLAQIDFLRHGFKVLTQGGSDEAIDRGPSYLATVYSWAQYKELADTTLLYTVSSFLVCDRYPPVLIH